MKENALNEEEERYCALIGKREKTFLSSRDLLSSYDKERERLRLEGREEREKYQNTLAIQRNMKETSEVFFSFFLLFSSLYSFF
jgi:hypothetical protein